MAQKQKRHIKEDKENAVYALLFFFVGSFFVKVVFGVITGCKSLLVSGIFAAFGIFISIVTLLRIHDFVIPAKIKLKKFSYGKLEFIIITGVSTIIAISTGAILFSILHMTFFHSLYPPGLMAAWASVFLAVASLYAAYKLKNIVSLILEEADIARIRFLLNKDFILSIAVVATVVIARSGFTVIDYILAIFEAGFIIAYSIYLLFNSVKGLMDASCDAQTVERISRHIRKADTRISIESIRVSLAGKMLEIVAIISVASKTPVKDARMLVQKIKYVLQKDLSAAHEIYIGFKGKEE